MHDGCDRVAAFSVQRHGSRSRAGLCGAGSRSTAAQRPRSRPGRHRCRRRDSLMARVNLGRVPGEKGIWNVPYITNMGDARRRDDGRRLAQASPRGRRGAARRAAARRRAARRRRRHGRRRPRRREVEPWVPFQPWAAAVYDYNSANKSKYDPEGYCLPPGGPRMMATPYPMEIIQLPEQKRIIMIFEGATHIWREIFMDGRPHPAGRRAQPDLPRSLGRPLGRRHARRRRRRFQRSDVARLLRPSAHRPAARRRAVLAAEQGARCTTKRSIDDPGAYTKPFTVRVGHSVERRRRADGIHLPGEQQITCGSRRRPGQPLVPARSRESVIGDRVIGDRHPAVRSGDRAIGVIGDRHPASEIRRSRDRVIGDPASGH